MDRDYLKFGISCGGQQLTWNTEGPPGPKGDRGFYSGPGYDPLRKSMP